METTETTTFGAIPEFLSGGGEMGQRIRDYDWASTPLGPVDTWPHSLRTCIRIMLTSRQPIWIGWGKELIKFYNDPYKAIVGGKHPWALGTPASVVWKDIWRDIEPMLRQVMEEDEGTYVESQLLIMERNGYPEETYYTFSYTPIPGDNGGTAGMICANTDDTDKIIIERQLRTLTQLGKRLTDCRNNEEIIHKTIETLQENPYDFPFAVFRTIAGNTATIAHSTPLGGSAPLVYKELHLDSDAHVAMVIRKALASRRPEVLDRLTERVGIMPKGAWEAPPQKAMVLPIVQAGTMEPHAVLVVGLNPYRLLDEKYSSFFSLVADQVATSFADVHAFEEERKRAEALGEIDRAKTAFFSNISHEFRTPLTLMIGPIEDALNDINTIPGNRVRLKVAHQNVMRLLKLVNSLLDFSRIEAGRMEARFELVDLAQMTRDLASIFRAAIEKAGMKLIVSCDDRVMGYVDVDMWEKIVLNLLSNAFKYTHEGSITVRLREISDQIELSVADTGVGIPQEELTRVFERFHRIKNTGGRSQEGTGIGLALVQELVKLHQGTIEAKSVVGEGTVFTVVINSAAATGMTGAAKPSPAAADISAKADVYLGEALKWLPGEEQDNEVVLEGGDGEATNQSTAGKKPKVLLADDNTDMRDYLRRLLSSRYDVVTVSNGRQALEKARSAEVDLIISDVMMPEMDGFELVRHLKENDKTRHTPIVLLSARAGEEATIEGLQTGADDYLVKPFSARELLSRIDSNLKIARSRVNAMKQLYNLFMQAPAAIAVLRGREQRFELANSAYLEIAGKDDVVGKTLLEAFPELEGHPVNGMLDGVYTSGIPFFGNEIGADLVRKGKKEHVFFNFVYSPMQEIDGTTSGVMVFATDVTEMVLAKRILQENEVRLEKEVQKRTEELRQTNRELEQSNRELEQYAFVTSHDLQEPLRKIQTFAHMIFERNSQRLDDKSLVHYQKVINAAQRMSSLINDLLNFSRLTQTGQYLPVDLNDVMANVENDFELVIHEKKARVRRGHLPVIDALPLQMNQLFSNLMGNALKFSSPDRIIEVDITAERVDPKEACKHTALFPEKTYCRIVFRDNGIGFDPVYSKKIFEVFQRLNDRSKYEGTGIGLALCSRIVVNHHGVIYAESTEGVGSEFHVILPLKQ